MSTEAEFRRRHTVDPMGELQVEIARLRPAALKLADRCDQLEQVNKGIADEAYVVVRMAHLRALRAALRGEG